MTAFSAAPATASEGRAVPAFSGGVVLALVLVGVVALAGLAVLSAFAPELRSGQDGRAHALSKSAVGYAGAAILMRELGAPASVSRVRPGRPRAATVVLAPDFGLAARELQAYPKGALTLIVLPKWQTAPDPIRPGFVRKSGVVDDNRAFTALLESYAPRTHLVTRKGATRPTLRGAGVLAGDAWRTGRIDRLRTISGAGWTPLIVDEAGNAVLAQSTKTPSVWVLADPDLLNNQGLASRDTARVAAAILDAARGEDRALVFDVTLNGYEKGRGLGRLMLEPPWLAATLIGVSAGVLMGIHALARFGQPRTKARAFALGSRALVDNSAGLVRLAKKEHEMAPAYAELNRAVVVRAAGGHSLEAGWLDDLARRRGAAAPDELAAQAEAAKTRDDLLAVAKKIYDWRGEMMRERR